VFGLVQQGVMARRPDAFGQVPSQAFQPVSTLVFGLGE
jgi:hypothetical protein